MLPYMYLYVITIPVLILLDLFWLGLVAQKFYQTQLASLLGPVNWPAAVAFYLVYVLGLIIFAVQPAINSQSLIKAIVLGALFGFVTYATYDLTNLATLRNWPLLVTIVDIMWGAVIGSSVATISYLIGKTFIF